MSVLIPAQGTAGGLAEYVGVIVGEQLFGLPIGRVQDVYLPERLTRVPLAPPDVAGVLNLRGRIVTLIDMRRRIGLPQRPEKRRLVAAGVSWRGESYGLLIDNVDEVLRLHADSWQPNPPNLDGALAPVAAGVHRLQHRLLVVLDVDRVIDIENRAGEGRAAA
jgi:purine-binding chemotaxis protein CheW